MLYADRPISMRGGLQIEAGTGQPVLCRCSTDCHDDHMGGQEPFGFTDGVSQPRIDWSGEREPDTTADLDYGNLLAAGEFLLGYRNEYGLYTDRPLLDPSEPGAAVPAGCARTIRRDVTLAAMAAIWCCANLHRTSEAFWRFIAAQAADYGGADCTGARRWWDADVGRCAGPDAARSRSAAWGRDDIDVARNQFTYDEDERRVASVRSVRMSRRAIRAPVTCRADAKACMARLIRMLGFGHQDLSEDLIAASRFHRIIRRGREFGDQIDWQAACAARCAGSAERAVLHVPQCQHLAPVRVHPERVADQREVRRHERRGRSAPRQSRADAVRPPDRWLSPCRSRMASAAGSMDCRHSSPCVAALISFCRDCGRCGISPQRPVAIVYASARIMSAAFSATM